MISFVNDGEMDLVAATTFGVSAKVGSNPVGFFGTGFKYAVAITLRYGGKATLWVGKKKYVFSAQNTEVRDKTFQIVTMNKRPLGFTTHMGANWEPWMAFRELYCNAKDEGGWATNHRIDPEDGKTTLWIENFAQMDKAFEHKREFFIEGEPLVRNAFGEVYQGESTMIFYRGIAVSKLEKPSLYTYNLTTEHTLTEDRTLKYPFLASSTIASMLASISNETVIENVVTAHASLFENTLNFNTGVTPSDKFLDVIDEIRRGPSSGLLNNAARDMHDKYRASKADPEEIKLNDEEKLMVATAYSYIERMGFVDFHGIQLIPVASLGQGVLGKAHKGKIFVSKRAFTYGQDTVTGTIFEELCHVRLQMVDETRDFQNFLINCVAQLGRRNWKHT